MHVWKLFKLSHCQGSCSPLTCKFWCHSYENIKIHLKLKIWWFLFFLVKMLKRIVDEYCIQKNCLVVFIKNVESTFCKVTTGTNTPLAPAFVNKNHKYWNFHCKPSEVGETMFWGDKMIKTILVTYHIPDGYFEGNPFLK